AALAGAGQRIFVVDARPVHADGHLAGRQVVQRKRLDAGVARVDPEGAEPLHRYSLRSVAMKYSIRLAVILAGVLAPLVTSFAAAPGRIEQGNLIFDGIPVEQLTADAGLPLALALESRSAAFADWLADGSMIIS